jgi:hypothetical protein
MGGIREAAPYGLPVLVCSAAGGFVDEVFRCNSISKSKAKEKIVRV